jgi:hypothetical protein
MQSFRKATTKTWGSISGGLAVIMFVAAFTLAWMEVTMKCVQCHKYVRGEASPTPR